MVLVLISFFVMALGITMSVLVTFSHFSDKASVILAAVNLQRENTARALGESSAMIESSCSEESVSACPDRFVFGIFRFPLIGIRGNGLEISLQALGTLAPARRGGNI